MNTQTLMMLLLFNLMIISFALKFLKSLNNNNKLNIKLNNNSKLNNKLNNKFYDVSIYPELENIKLYKDDIHTELREELKKNNLDHWYDWPEKDLYDTSNNIWKIMPFYYYGTWSKQNCEKMPQLTKFLKSLSGLKIALLSILSPHTKLNEHKGWGNHSNNVLRCHYGLLVPSECTIVVREDNEILGSIRQHKKDEWLIFDDSKNHFAINNSDYHRIVLIIDLKRPKNIKKGTSDIGDTKELLEIVEYFKKNQEQSNQLDVQDKNLLNQTDLDLQKQD